MQPTALWSMATASGRAVAAHTETTRLNTAPRRIIGDSGPSVGASQGRLRARGGSSVRCGAQTLHPPPRHGEAEAPTTALLLLEEGEGDSFPRRAAQSERHRGRAEHDGLSADDAQAAGLDRVAGAEVESPLARLLRVDEHRLHAV